MKQGRAFLKSNSGITDVDRVCEFAVYYYRRFIGEDFEGVDNDMRRWITGEISTGAITEAGKSALVFWRTFKVEHA
jgi:hypothetical protein